MMLTTAHVRTEQPTMIVKTASNLAASHHGAVAQAVTVHAP